MISIQLRSKRPDAWVKAQRGRRATPEDYTIVVQGSAKVYKPNGELLLAVVKRAISAEAAESAYPFLHSLRNVTTSNRGLYSGEKRFARLKRDGTLSNTTQTPPVRSALAGFLDRSPRYPFCNCMPVVQRNREGWATFQPMAAEVSALFEKLVPGRFAAQMEHVKKVHPAYVIPGTAFSTVTINNTVAGGYHVDAGDFKPGFGAMSVLRRGTYRGGLLAIPAYGVAVDLEDRDVILFDVHEVHGNTPLEGEGPATKPEEGGHERISVVYYLRTRMVDCLPPDEELARIRDLRGGLTQGPEGLEDEGLEDEDNLLDAQP